MNKNVLVALDGSAAAALAVPTARTIAKQIGATVRAVHVLRYPEIELRLRHALGLDRSELADIPLDAPRGNPVDVLPQLMSRRDVAVLVMTTHGREVLRGRPLARIPEAVAASATRPIVLVRPEAVAPIGAQVRAFDRMLLPLDGKKSTATALGPAVRLARQLGCALDILYVFYAGQAHPGESGMVPPRYLDQPYMEWPGWQEEAQWWLRTHCRSGVTYVPTDIHVRGGVTEDAVGATIASVADELRASGIILVRRGTLGPSQEPVARSVLDLAPCPVLLVPSRQAKRISGRRRAGAGGTGAAPGALVART
jgi:nucleotide-binding universal stress UspA family protein